MTDPIVKEALLGLCDVMRTLTKLVDYNDRRLRRVEEELFKPKLRRLVTPTELKKRVTEHKKTIISPCTSCGRETPCPYFPNCVPLK